MIIAVSWGYPKFGVDRGYWEGPAASNITQKQFFKEKGAEYDDARSFIEWIEAKGFRRVNIDGVHFDRKGRRRADDPITGLD